MTTFVWMPRRLLAMIALALAASLSAAPAQARESWAGLFQTARTGGIGEYDEIEETMAPVALETVADWIRARFVGRR